MVVISIAGILAVLAAPSFNGFLDRTQASARINNFYDAILVARSEAIRRNTQTTLCPSVDNTTCNAGASSADFAAQNWIVRDAAGNVIRVWEAITIPRCAVSAAACRIIVFPITTRSLSYNPNGTAFTGNNTPAIGVAIIKNGATTPITINATGKPRI